MVLQSTVDTRVGLLKDDYVQMDMEHRKQERRIESLHKQKEEEVSLEILSQSFISVHCSIISFRIPNLNQNTY